MVSLKWFIVVVAVVGVILFLYGANYGTSIDYYDPVVGWIGVALVAASVVAFLALYVYDELTKK
ncbi:MAG TPA: hypothetical protein VK209_08910 [Candidatus Sulfotelmatobacter sp.]|jgi:drug/metabolite transporter (DMT)-like permease|nr:hypothetical protein [Candidatus Sulfotelmatobacter sp.]